MVDILWMTTAKHLCYVGMIESELQEFTRRLSDAQICISSLCTLDDSIVLVTLGKIGTGGSG
jgi:hypothetical protein